MKSNSKCCFVCQCPLIGGDEENNSSSSCKPRRELGSVEMVGFLLRTLLELPKEKVNSWEDERGGGFGRGFKVCEGCEEMIEQCWEIYKRLEEIWGRYREMKLKVVGKMEEFGGDREVEVEGIPYWKEAHYHVKRHVFEEWTDPFVTSRLRSGQEGMVKEEPSDDEEEEEEPLVDPLMKAEVKMEQDQDGDPLSIEEGMELEDDEQDESWKGDTENSDQEEDSDQESEGDEEGADKIPKQNDKAPSKTKPVTPTKKDASSSSLTCHYCSKQYSSKYKLQNHIDVQHEKTKSFTCDICGKGFTTPWCVDKHKRRAICRLKAKSKTEQAKDSEGDNEAKSDTIPEEAGEEDESWKGDTETSEEEDDDTDQDSEEDEESEEEGSTDNDTDKISKKNDNDPKDTPSSSSSSLTCHYCNKQYSSKYVLQIHIGVKHEKTISFTCDVCGKGFSDAAGVKRHKRKTKCILKAKAKAEEGQSTSGGGNEKKSEIDTIPNEIDGGDLDSDTPRKPPPKKKRKRIQTPLKPEDRNVECPHCHKIYCNKYILQNHVRVAHLKTVSFPCTICNRKFSDRSGLKRHRRKKHSGQIMAQKRFVCNVEDCGRKYKTEIGYRLHLKNHETKKVPQKFSCDVCDKKFLWKTGLKYHQRDYHGPPRKYQCDLCSFGTEWAINLALHKKKIHTNNYNSAQLNEDLPPKFFPCPVDTCTETFPQSSDLRKHMKTHPEQVRKEAIGLPTVYPCPQCGKTFPNTKRLEIHEAVHTPEVKPYVCQICGKGFGTKPRLQAHQNQTLRCKRLHMNESEATYVCYICGKRSSSEMSLAKHIRFIHEKKFPAKCTICGRDCRTTVTLKRHLAKNHQIGDFKCQEEPTCTKVFSSQEDLNWHVAHKHKNEAGNFPCQYCGKRFTRQKYRRQHERGVHLGVKLNKPKPKRDENIVNN